MRDGMTCLPQRIERQASDRPDAIAVSCEGRTLTYGTLNARANRLAHRLRALGVGPDVLVAIGLERSPEMIVGLLGILKAGGAYLPIDPDHPRERLAFTLDDARPRVVLTSAACRSGLPETDATVLELDPDWRAFDDQPETDPIPVAGPSDLAYVIYTSGSTGRPKGCQLTHANVARLFTETQPWFDFGPDDVWTFFHSHAFDFSVWEIWGALVHGGRVVVVPSLVSREPEAFHALLVREGVTVLNQTPSAFRGLIHVDVNSAVPASALALRVVIFGGEALQLQMLAPWIQRHGDQQPRLINMYGITETTVHVTYRPITADDLARRVGSVIGQPIPDLRIFVLDPDMVPVPVGEIGELYVAGAGVCRGYLNRPQLNAERFLDWQAPDGTVYRLYRTGDLARPLADGDLDYRGRTDHQVKIRGFRIETGEIESVLARHPGVRACAVIARTDDASGEPRLVAYVVPSAARVPPPQLRAHLAQALPDYMLPAAFVDLAALPMTGNGKLDRQALPAPDQLRPELSSEYEDPVGARETELCQLFAGALAVDRVGRHDNFFELGGDSLAAVRLVERIRDAMSSEAGSGNASSLPVTALFQNPTPARLAALLDARTEGRGAHAPRPATRAGAGSPSSPSAQDEPIAIIAMAGRFPGAADVEAFWRNLCEGRDSITHFAPGDLDPAVAAAERDDPAYVAARGVIDGVELFDAGFFGIAPREAELMDPQQRIFLELSWECMERAGHVPGADEGPVAVFAGMYNASYFQRHVSAHPELIDRIGAFQVMLDNEKDFIATRVAHKLNLTGPAISVHTACSTSLVAICMAVDSLRAHQCDMALAGGITVTCPPRSGYFHQEGAMLSPDGRTRTFDADAQGTVFSDGGAVVLLKRLGDAQADGDPIVALIRGGAINNDGGDKASFTAPSSAGQAAVIALALERAGVQPRSIGYVEAHGTATPLGDPIELEGLTQAFRQGTDDIGFCRIGSVKSNVGHLVIAAGAAGVIKTALALAERRIPPSLHFTAANPVIDFARSPFVVNDRLSEWPDGPLPRRAGVSSFGVGGTNAHVVLEQAPVPAASEPAEGPQLLVLSARTPAALGLSLERLADHLGAHPQENLADIAWTLSTGRKAFRHRAAIVAPSVPEAIAALRDPATVTAAARSRPARASELVFVFPGQGATYPGMGRDLHATEPVFRLALDQCAELLRPCLGFDLRERMFDDDAEALLPTSIMQPATFAIEYALARLWLNYGLAPVAMAGHSVGEFVAATLAGVFGLEDALRLVALRGQLMQAQPSGGMLSVRMPLESLRARMPDSLSLAAENAPGACVVAGEHRVVADFQASLEADGIACRALRTSHAFHSQMMAPVVAPFREAVEATRRAAPALPIVSTATGDWLDAEQAVSPEYWSRHLLEPVRFASAVERLLDQPSRVLLEVGPRTTLTTLARQHPLLQKQQAAAVASLAAMPGDESAGVRRAAGQLWCHGVVLDSAVFDRRARRGRVRLPTYPFERQRYWVDAMPAAVKAPTLTPEADSPATTTSTVTQDAAEPLAATNAHALVTDGAPVDDHPRRARLLAQLRTTIEDLAGFDLADADADANFIELGLDSLMLTQLALQLQKSFGVGIGFRQLMGEYASLGRLASALDAQLPVEAAAGATATAASQADAGSGKPAGPQPTADPREAETAAADGATRASAMAAAGADAVDRVVPTTESQREIWLADQLGRDASLAYNLSVSLQLQGVLDVGALRAALQDLVDRHEALRASVGPDGTDFRISAQCDLPLEVHDFRSLAPGARVGAIAERLRASVETPFDLAQGPLFRAELLRLGDEQFQLVLTAHHIACDGWSWWIIVRELGALYGRRCGQACALPEAASFADFALAEAQHALDPAHARDEAFWQSRFAVEPPVLELPLDRPRPAQRSFESAREDHALDAELLAGLRRLGAQRGNGLFATLLAGFSTLLSKLSGQADIVVGIPAAGQPVVGQDHLVGHCVNLLPLRFDLDPAQTFAQVQDAAQGQLLDALEHQRYTFGTLLKTLHVRRDPARTPLVSVLFNLDQALDQEGAAFPGLSLEFDSNARSYETFELFVNAVQCHGQLRLECQYNSRLFDRDTIHRWMRAYEALLRAAVGQGTTVLAELPLVDGAALSELAALQPLPVAFDRAIRMHEHFEMLCDRAPDRIAVQSGSQRASYAQLEQRANRIAHALRGHGVRRGALVGLALDRGIDMLAGLLGVLKAGAAYVPLDPEFPGERLAYMAGDAGLALLLTTREHAGQFDMHGRPVVTVDGDASALARMPDTRIGRDQDGAGPEDPAYVIYTSGSTGRPKGVVVPHRAVANFIASMQREPGLTSDDRLVAVTTLSFDIAVLELLLPLSVGAGLVIADRETAGDGSRLRALLASSGATAMQGTPSTWRLLLDAGWMGSGDFKVLCGGEALSPTLASALLPRCGALWNLYGPTETTVWSTCARITPPAADARPDVTIGRPIANTQVWVLDRSGAPCPLGMPGEIHIGGAGMTLGYLNRPRLTAERFIADPFADTRAATAAGGGKPLLYRTGDRGRWRPDGNLEHLGRLDHQVKVRGYRIELGEIEANLLACDEVAAALVMVREDREGDQRLVAYVVAQPGKAIREADLRSYLRGILPAYMQPQHFVVLAQIPLLPNGKVDRNALPAPVAAVEARPAPPPATGSAADPRVGYLAGIWSELLGVPAGPGDNFFDLGGHSMLAVQMASRVERDTGERIKLIRLGAQTLEQVAASLPAPTSPHSTSNGGLRIGEGLRRLFGLRAGARQ